MRAKHKQRLALVVLLVLGVGISVALALTAFNKNLQAYFTPTEIANGEAPKGQTINVGGLVKEGSVQRASDSLKIQFDVSDTAKEVNVVYEGILPDLFREGQGIVVTGRIQQDGTFLASEVLAKHDETYMPPAAKDAIDAAQHGKNTAPHGAGEE
ncbi:cytochrome c maturation protein CcmE [Candidatus Venteria ishoeyi]|uniref:Cytochrome c-type biogenesis protein CcmE n=1 Tax=Candidatus Venteria ishoeyi TaxID=1899563 RepID=A0A1H6F6V2_9GAMM|nr:cytochrome c maturation protein CcmE [Candidatus Venteria ishoeyi]MDM8547821.1 cytochrome c maturation protein CcmE [Candidatus Venteria ishoeyi]SEH05867.1 Cytochrome c-type biogenesis protein CcmE [Candidatus Venteria ishoeyi]